MENYPLVVYRLFFVLLLYVTLFVCPCGDDDCQTLSECFSLGVLGRDVGVRVEDNPGVVPVGPGESGPVVAPGVMVDK